MYFKKALDLFYKTGFFFLLLLTSFISFAQNTTIRGTVKDAAGQPLAGASVLLEGTRFGTVTDANGTYTLTVTPGNYTVIISYVGVQTQRQTVNVPAGGISDLSFDMQNSGELNRVIVVGSRSATVRSSTQTVAPVDVITARELQGTGQIEPTQMINVVAPSFNSSRQTVADGTDHIDPATLRGLGPDQVLVLVNGRRRYNTALINVNGTVGRGSVGTDLNSIPAASIERIEVLRDGASSQYGSDAIAGVINIVLKKNQKGTSVYSHFGQQYKEDGGTRQVGFTQGLSLGKEGFLTLSGDLRHRDATSRTGRYTGTVYVNDVVQDEGIIAERGFSRFNNMVIGNSEVDNAGLVLNMGAPLSSKVRFFATGSLSQREGNAAGFYRYPKQTTQVIAELYPDGFLPRIFSTIIDRSLIGGLEGTLGKGWNWDLGHAAGSNSFTFDIKNTNNASQYAQGANAQTEFYAGKLRFMQNTSNLNISRDFGSTIGLKSFNVAFGGELRFDNYTIEEGEEASWRNYDPNSGRAGGAQVFNGFQPTNAVDETRTVYGGYVDIETDLSDKFLVNAAGRFEDYSDFGSNVAGKLALRYKIIDALSIRGTVSNGFRAPSVHQRHFSYIQTVFINTSSGLTPVQNGIFRNNSDLARSFGIEALKAEKSTNFSAGITSRFKGFNLTVDGYMIDIKDRIVITGAFTRALSPVINNLLIAYPEVNSASFFTNAIDTRTKGIDVVLSRNFNLRKGVLNSSLAANFNETEVTKNKPLPSQLASDENIGKFLFNPQERTRIEKGQPTNKISLGINYTGGPWILNLRTTRYGEVSQTFFNTTSGALDPTRDQTFDAKIVTDANVGLKIANFATLSIGANNIGDVYPDKLTNLLNTGEGRFVYSRETTQFGFNGGYYYTSLVLDLHNIKASKKPKPAPMPETPVDSDSDGTPDATDACPTLPGLAALSGCPDGDGDGIADKDDACPTVAGAKIFNGCPDSDGDGVEDSKDKCPLEAGIARYNGCPVPDTDRDGVNDELDRCPTVPGDPSNAGCPKEVAKEVQKQVDRSAREIYFQVNSAQLKVTSGPALDAIADILKQDGALVQIEGHTDNTGSNAFNQKLSEERANSVKQALIKRGVDETKIKSAGYGEEQPIADNNTAEGRTLNRRVVVKLSY